MTIKNVAGVSALEMTQRFDLLATDAKEYAVFLVGLLNRTNGQRMRVLKQSTAG